MSSLIHRIAATFSCLRQDACRRRTVRRSTIESLETRTLLTLNLVTNMSSSQFTTPSNFTEVNGTLFFTAAIDQHGLELWKTNGTAAGTVLVKDILSGSSGANPFSLTNVNGTLFFSADDGMNGNELWKSDGTEAGTVMVSNIRSGSGSAYPFKLTNVDGTLYFRALDGVHGNELWKSDGTTTGTVLVKDIRSGGPYSNSYPDYLTNVNGTLYFGASDGINGAELWKSDGTEAGTVMVKDIRLHGSAAPFHLTNVNGTLYFRAALDGVNGHQLWRSNGTEAGTVKVKDINTAGSTDFDSLTNVNGTLYFVANDGMNGRELWKSDGTSAGTALVKDIRIGSMSAKPAYLTSVVRPSLELVNGTLYFRANDGVNGYELWKSDGTSAGTVMVKDISSGSSSAHPRYLTNVNGTLYFRAHDVVNGYELWKSDGTETGTQLVANIGPGATGSGPTNLTVVGSQLYFMTTVPQFGEQLYRLSENSPPTNVGLSTNSIPENAGVNAVIGNLSGTDPDPGDTLTFSLPSGIPNSNNNLFNINGTTLRANSSFDFESGSSYSITVRATDAAGLFVETSFSITVTNVTELTGIDVQRGRPGEPGQTQRSYVRYLDVLFDQSNDLMSTINNGRLQLTKRDLNGASPSILSFSTPTINGNNIRLDFGAEGLGGNRNNNVGDGYYELGVDMDGNGTFESKKYFHRLLGDLTGDGVVDSFDKAQFLGRTGATAVENDVNGDGLFDLNDSKLISRAIGTKLEKNLFRND